MVNDHLSFEIESSLEKVDAFRPLFSAFFDKIGCENCVTFPALKNGKFGLNIKVLGIDDPNTKEIETVENKIGVSFETRELLNNHGDRLTVKTCYIPLESLNEIKKNILANLGD